MCGKGGTPPLGQEFSQDGLHVSLFVCVMVYRSVNFPSRRKDQKCMCGAHVQWREDSVKSSANQERL